MPHTPLLTRIRGEYLEMPGLRLTFQQAQRLFGFDCSLCKTVLEALVAAKFLGIGSDGAYARLNDGGDVPRPRPAKADIRAGSRSLKAS